MKRNGFTLVELLIVVAILGILAAVVIPNVIGLMGRGAKQAYETDQEVVQLAVATFYSDTHAGFNPSGYWCDSDYADASGHYYPTAIGAVNDHLLVLNYGEVDEENNPRVDNGDVAAIDADISSHAIWMGLLVNRSGDYPPVAGGTSDRISASPLDDDTSLYLQERPQSASGLNADANAEGFYTWVAGRNGQVYGVYKSGDFWYSGFGGAYP